MGFIVDAEKNAVNKLFSPEAVLADYQAFSDRSLVLANMISPRTLAMETAGAYAWEEYDPIETDDLSRQPTLYHMPGSDFPLIDIKEGTRQVGQVYEYAIAADITALGKRDTKQMLKAKQTAARGISTWIETQIYNGLTNSATSWTDGGEFDTFLGSSMNGGYVSAGGYTNSIAIGLADGYQWDTDRGDPINDMRKILQIYKDQRIAVGTTTDALIQDPRNAVWIMDSLTFTAIQAYLEDFRFPMTATPNGFLLPNLQNVEIVEANYALTQALVNIGGTSTEYGISLLFDKSNYPFEAFQYFMPYDGFQTLGGVEGSTPWKIQYKYIPNLNQKLGNDWAGWVTSCSVNVTEPRRLMTIGGFRSGLTIAP